MYQTNKIMQPHEQQVADEYFELNKKAKALYMVLAGKTFETLDHDDQELLKMQYYTMMVYCGILQKRIAKFPS
jgi:hypothetical protein